MVGTDVTLVLTGDVAAEARWFFKFSCLNFKASQTSCSGMVKGSWKEAQLTGPA